MRSFFFFGFGREDRGVGGSISLGAIGRGWIGDVDTYFGITKFKNFLFSVSGGEGSFAIDVRLLMREVDYAASYTSTAHLAPGQMKHHVGIHRAGASGTYFLGQRISRVEGQIHAHLKSGGAGPRQIVEGDVGS